MRAAIQIADLAKTVMPGNPEAAVTLLIKDHPTTVASTGQLATDLDETQYERGHGPCLHAARTGELTEIAPTAAGRTTCRGPPSTAPSAPCRSRWQSTTSRSPAH